MDFDGYPDDQELQRIREWPHKDFPALMEFVRTLWKWNDWGWSQQGRKYRISTGGWSGNESLISALEGNVMFWMMCWHQSKRGGHYTFIVPKATPGPAGDASEEGRGGTIPWPVSNATTRPRMAWTCANCAPSARIATIIRWWCQPQGKDGNERKG